MSVTRNRFTGLELALAGALLLMVACSGHEPAPPPASEVEVRAELSRAQRLEAPGRVELFGVVEAEKTATVSVRVMAVVTAILVQPGDTVRSGQLLLTIDAQAARGQVTQAEGALAQARAALVLAERNFERFRALAEADAASELELDMARMQFEQARGAVEQAEGAAASASAVAADSRVVAPFAGTVSRKMVEVGDLAAPGRPLLTIESAGRRRLVLAVPESVMAGAAITPGDTLRARIDSRRDLGEIAAEVIEVAPGADPVSHSFQVKVDLPVTGIPTGAAGRAWVEVELRTVIAVPTEAVLRQGGLALVVLRTPEGRASSRVVTLGELLSDGRIEVLSGLIGDETVLVGLRSAPPMGAVVASPDTREERTP